MSPTTRLQQDGYKIAMTVSDPEQLGQSELTPYVAKGQPLVIGTKGDKAEIIVPLNDAGAKLVKDQLGTVSESIPGATAHMDGNDVTIVAPASSLGEAGLGNQPTPEPTPPVETAPAPETPTEPAAPAEQSGPVGTTFTITDDVGMYGTNTVSVDKVTYGLAAYDEYSAPASGHQLVGITVTAKSVKLGDPSSSGVNPVSFTALGSDGVGYEAEGGASDSGAAMYATTFSGDFKFTGQHETGVIAFEMPKGVTITQVKYDGGDTPVTWSVGK